MEYRDKIGLFIDVPNVGKGQIKYIGPVADKHGAFVGLDLMANVGKNDGSFKGKRYFTTKFPQSGLFMLWEKVAGLIPQPSIRSSKNVSLSPTPVRISEHQSELETPINSLKSFSNENLGRITPNGDDRNRIEAELFQYKRLVDDQRIVLEEIQLAIDEYEQRLETTEHEKVSIQKQLDYEKEKHDRLKQFYEKEHEQLLAVIDELQLEINRNASALNELMDAGRNDGISSRTNPTTPMTDEDKVDNTMHDDSLYEELKEQVQALQLYKDRQEKHIIKWQKEREQLKMHNNSLSAEYTSASSELLTCQRQLDQKEKRIQQLEEELKNTKKNNFPETDLEENNCSLPLYNPSSDLATDISKAASGRSLWCALCEKDGHESVDCPYEDKLF